MSAQYMQYVPMPPKRRKPRLSWAAASTLAVLLIVAMIPCAWFIHYDRSAYDVDQAQDWIYRARATNDLVDMAKYLNESLVLLAPYEGNPNWWFPRPDTDFGLIKSNIEECVRNCAEFSTLENEMAYQQAVHNLQETELEIADHLAIAGYWTFNTPSFVVGFWLGLVCGLVWVPVLLAVIYGFKDWD